MMVCAALLPIKGLANLGASDHQLARFRILCYQKRLLVFSCFFVCTFLLFLFILGIFWVIELFVQLMARRPAAHCLLSGY